MKLLTRAAFALERAVLLAVLVVGSSPPLSAESPAGGGGDEAEVYRRFRAWAVAQPEGGEDLLDRYRSILAAEGLDAAEVERRIGFIDAEGQRLEADFWNRVLTSPTPHFNTEPNAFLVEMTRGRPPGRALDVGMGQGRNALYLAAHGWQVTGFDPADRAVAAAVEEAHRRGLTLEALVLRDDQFDFGEDRWDLIVLSYVGLRDLVPRLYAALAPGGLVVVEAFHRDATASAPIGGAVVFDSNELLRLFDRFRIVRYEDTTAVADFGLAETRLVRLAAEKPRPAGP